jgi:prepilin-type N-terminal cleavage/methylation domain-containing protein
MGRMITPTSRQGFSLIELLVALVLLSGGLAVAAGVSRHAMRAVAAGGRRSVAATLAAGNLDSLASMPCANRGAGASSRRGVTLTWSVLDSAGASFVQQTVAFVGGSGLVTRTFETLLPC